MDSDSESRPTEDDRDEAVVAITNDGAFRIIVAQGSDMVQGVIDAQSLSGAEAALAGEMVLGTTLFRVLMSPDSRVQAILKGAGEGGHIVADSHPDGWSRGLAQRASAETEIALGDDAVLQMMRTLANGRLHQGVVEAPRDGGVAAALMNYLQHSEQIVSVACVHCTIDESKVTHALGFVVQLLAEAPEGALAVMTERLAHDFSSLETFIETHGERPRTLLAELSYGMESTVTHEEAIRFGCACSRVRVMASLGTLGREDIEDLMKDGEAIDLNCDYCNQAYQIAPEELRGLLASS